MSSLVFGLVWLCLCILMFKLPTRLQLKCKITGKCPFDLQFEDDVVDLIKALKIHQANFISLVQKSIYSSVLSTCRISRGKWKSR